MAYHHLLINETKKEYLDLGKFCRLTESEGGVTFQMKNSVLFQYLYDNQRDHLIMADDGGFYDLDDYIEIDSWHKHLPEHDSASR